MQISCTVFFDVTVIESENGGETLRRLKDLPVCHGVQAGRLHGVGDQLVGDLHELLVDLLVVLGVSITEKQIF